MAIGWNPSHYFTDSGNSRSSSALTHTAPAVSDGLLLVFVHGRSSAARTISSVKRGATDLTKIGGASIRNEYVAGFYHYLEFWYEIGPPSGSQTINTVYSGSMSSDVVEVFYLSGVHGSPVGNSGTNTGSGTTPTIDLVTGTAQSWVVASATQRRANGGTYTAGADDVKLGEGETGAATAADVLWVGLYTAAGAAGTYTVSAVNGTSSSQWTVGAVEIKELSSSGHAHRKAGGRVPLVSKIGGALAS